MAGTSQTDDDGRPPCGVYRRLFPHSQRLCKQGEQGEEGKDEHGEHTTSIGVHTLLLYKELGQITTEDAQEGYDEVECENKQLTHTRRCLVTKLVREVGRSPEQVEPPNAVGHELTHDERPSLLVSESLAIAHLRALVNSVLRVFVSRCILVDIG